jgi:hypothetical protein
MEHESGIHHGMEFMIILNSAAIFETSAGIFQTLIEEGNVKNFKSSKNEIVESVDHYILLDHSSLQRCV